MPGVGLIRSKLRPSRWLSPKSKQSFSKRRLLITASSKSFSARCANSVSKSSSDRHRESANAPVANIPKVTYLSAIPSLSGPCIDRGERVYRFTQHRFCAHLDRQTLGAKSLGDTERERRRPYNHSLNDVATQEAKEWVAGIEKHERTDQRRRDPAAGQHTVRQC